MDKITKQFLVALGTLLCLDYVWLTLNKQSYARATFVVQKTKMVLDMRFAVLAYTIMAVGLYLILTDIEHHKTRTTKLTRAFLWGIVIYGVYNATNAAVFSNYDLTVAIKDTLWGGVVYTSAVAVALFI